MGQSPRYESGGAGSGSQYKKSCVLCTEIRNQCHGIRSGKTAPLFHNIPSFGLKRCAKQRIMFKKPIPDDWVVGLGLTPRTSAAPAMPPPHCANTYMMQRNGDTKRVKSSPIVTAGFAWPPDTCNGRVVQFMYGYGCMDINVRLSFKKG